MFKTCIHFLYINFEKKKMEKKKRIMIMFICASYFCVLTLYHTILTFNDPDKEAFLKHCGKKRKCWKLAFSHLPTMFSTLSKPEIPIWTTVILLSAKCFQFGYVQNFVVW